MQARIDMFQAMQQSLQNSIIRDASDWAMHGDKLVQLLLEHIRKLNISLCLMPVQIDPQAFHGMGQHYQLLPSQLLRMPIWPDPCQTLRGGACITCHSTCSPGCCTWLCVKYTLPVT